MGKGDASLISPRLTELRLEGETSGGEGAYVEAILDMTEALWR
jgi:hypothetical protein